MRNNSVLFKIVAFVFVISSITSCYKDDISDLDTRIEGIESDTISSIKSQISMINASIDNLKITDQDVKNLISALQNTAAEMQRSLNYTNEKLDSSNISNVNLIGELKIYTDNKLSEINLFIQYLQAKDDSLTENISSLQKYVDNAIYDTRFWAETTFTTLEQYDSVTNSIAGIKVAIASIENAISELEGRVNAKIESDINAAVIGMNASLKDSVISITQAYKNAISDANKAITAAYNDAIAKSIAKSEDSMKDWVNSQLSGYYTIEQADANLDALTINIISMLESLELKYDSIINAEGEYRDTIISRIETKIDSICGEVSNNKTQIQTIKSDLVKLRNDLTAEYRNAIETAIHEYDGKFDSITTARVVAVNKSIVDRLDGRIDSLCVLVSTNRKDIDSIFNSISDLVSKVEVLRTDVDALLATVQSITIIPEYSDGSVSLLKLTPKANKYRFEIYPESVAQQLAEAGTGVFSMKAVYTMTKAVGSSVDMPVTAVSYNNGI